MLIKKVMELSDIRSVKNIKNKRVLVRASLNAPIIDGEIVNDFRLRSDLATLNYLKEEGAKTIIIGHTGRDPKLTLRPVFESINKHIRLIFVDQLLGPKVEQAIRIMHEGDIIMLENLRGNPGEHGNDIAFAKALAALADIYVNDALAVSHREHASVVGAPRYLPHYAGVQLIREIEGLTRALSPHSPSLCILAGAKSETKEPLIRKLLKSYDRVFIGGVLANDFFKAEGLTIGQSAVSENVKKLEPLVGHKKIILPSDVVVENSAGTKSVKRVSEVGQEDRILDAGPRTVGEIKKFTDEAAYILWNGPLGDYEEGFTEATEHLARIIATSRAFSVVGGGDTVGMIANLGLENHFSFVSTGGGAMLQFLVDETLPGIEALKKEIVSGE